jgi:hypothetical protein
VIRRLILVAILLVLGFETGASASDPPCVTRAGNGCGGVSSDQASGDFKGIIMVPGDDGILDIAMNSGSQPGCGDCVWTLVIACVHDSPDNPHNQVPCNGAGQSQKCGNGQTLYRVFLATDTEANHLVDTVCLGGPNDVVAVSNVAANDVDRYLKDVVPPTMRIGTQPPSNSLAGVPTYFRVTSPNPAPQQFGGPAVTETITITPATYTWEWGDGSPALQTKDPGGTYPDGHVAHTYVHAAHISGTLTTEWSATYTITAAGRTLGPFNATGTVTRPQPFTLTVDRARSHLVSH